MHTQEARAWLQARPQAYAVVYVRDRRDFESLDAAYKQVYRGHGVVLLASPAAQAWLARHESRD
jgi:hypothetical protein